ncbi:MAG TPA: hypothetical protein VN924_25355 [Bryobacteraceae bacterium]|nr:hypothetical protein [Bryobacteraceae bacterium]
MSPLAEFDPLVRDWFTQHFAAATEPQIVGGRRSAPVMTPSSPRLQASARLCPRFLPCLDRLVRAARHGPLPDQTEVVYVSPLKALSNDIHINLEVPLSEIAATAVRKKHGLRICHNNRRCV